MRWRQFLTPVSSLNFEQCKTFLDGMSAHDVTILDVRQPNEYQNGHIPGATLIPLPQLERRIAELDPQKPTVVYCAVGGRSRIAAQMLMCKGFGEVFNLTGGIRAWESQTALGGEDMGLMLFNGQETVAQCLAIAYALEGGLRDFYETMATQVTQMEVRNLFTKLATIETKHQDQLFSEYAKLNDASVDRESFQVKVITQVAEGGLTAKEYSQLYEPNWESALEIAAMAMTIEAQALDLYLRASRRSKSEALRNALKQIAAEENLHMDQLGQLIESLQT